MFQTHNGILVILVRLRVIWKQHNGLSVNTRGNIYYIIKVRLRKL